MFAIQIIMITIKKLKMKTLVVVVKGWTDVFLSVYNTFIFLMYQTDHHDRNDDRQHIDNENGGGQTGRTDALLSVSSQRTTCDYLLTRPSS